MLASVQKLRPTEYQSIVGSLQYLACVSRPDIAYAASTLGSFNTKPSVVHLSAAKHVVRYLKDSAKLGITYVCSDSFSLTGYMDPNYFHSGADSVNIGYVFKIAGGTVTWRSKKAKYVIPQSTAELELCALNAGVCELQWICDLLEQLHIDMPQPLLLCDNQAAVQLARSGYITEDNKHYRCNLRLLHNLFQQGMYKLGHIPSKSQAAGYLTKSLLEFYSFALYLYSVGSLMIAHLSL